MRFTARLRGVPSSAGTENLKEKTGEDYFQANSQGVDVLPELFDSITEEDLQSQILSIETYKRPSISFKATRKLPQSLLQANADYLRTFKIKLRARYSPKTRSNANAPPKQLAKSVGAVKDTTRRAARAAQTITKLVRVVSGREEASEWRVEERFSRGFNRKGTGVLKRLSERYLAVSSGCPFVSRTPCNDGIEASCKFTRT